jgi:hypothetical protein
MYRAGGLAVALTVVLTGPTVVGIVGEVTCYLPRKGSRSATPMSSHTKAIAMSKRMSKIALTHRN